jgi:drug/metabolite transporter (DMT)-like permease
MSVPHLAYWGATAGVLTSVFWTASSLLFTSATRRLKVTTVNCTRLAVAVVLLAVTHRLAAGAWIPDALPKQVVFLGLSGIVGLSIGDQALFRSFVYVGPRLAMLVMTTSPLIATLFGWVVLGEQLSWLAWLGMLLTIGGICWVVAERTEERQQRPAYYVRGLWFAFVGAVCQAGGLLLSKQGIGHGWLPREEHLSPQAATLVRMFFATLAILPVLAWQNRRARRVEVEADPDRARIRRTGLMFTLCAAVVGPYLGVWMSLVAGDLSPLGVAQTLCSLTPVFILPIVAITGKEHISGRAVAGAIIAVLGSSLLFVRG